MSHEIEMVAGKASMFFVGKTPWHKLGTRLQAAPTSAEAMRLAGLDWAVESVSLVSWDEDSDVPNHKGIRRVSDKKILGVVGKNYQPLQNAEAFGFFDPFIAAGEAAYETAGSLRGGARIWVLAKLNREPSRIVGDDTVDKYVLLSNGHDGSLAVRVGFSPVRTVCANTLAQAHGDERSALIRVRHSDKVASNLTAIREVMDMANASFEASAEQYRALARREINQDDLKKYVKQVFTPKKAQEEQEEATPSSDPGRVYESVARLFETGRGTDLPGVKGTWWGAYNAVNEYLNYERGKDEEVRLNNLWYGEGASINERALQYAYNVVAA